MTPEVNKQLSLSQGEISALKKAIMYLKFSCEETESLQFAASPLINSFLNKLLVIDDLGAQASAFYQEHHPEHEHFILSKLSRMNEENHSRIPDEVMQKTYQECLHPFK